jgi:hypothetical protein
MQSLDKIEPPCTFYYEDTDGNEVPFDWNNGMPDRKWHAQHSKGVLVQHSICFGERNKKKDLWPVRLTKWLLYRMPTTWKKSEISMSFNTTINHDYQIIKYLVENRKFKFNDACVVVSELCGRCSDIIYSELNNATFIDSYCSLPNMCCNYCNTIDPIYSVRRRVWCCYRTIKLGGDVKKAYKENSPNGNGELQILKNNKWLDIKNEIFTFFRRLLSLPQH